MAGWQDRSTAILQSCNVARNHGSHTERTRRQLGQARRNRESRRRLRAQLPAAAKTRPPGNRRQQESHRARAHQVRGEGGRRAEGRAGGRGADGQSGHRDRAPRRRDRSAVWIGDERRRRRGAGREGLRHRSPQGGRAGAVQEARRVHGGGQAAPRRHDARESPRRRRRRARKSSCRSQELNSKLVLSFHVAATVAERTLPHNLEAERSVLGAILLHNDAFNLAAEVIKPDDFFRDAHRRIYEKMIALAERGDAIDLVTLKEVLGRSGEIDEVGGPAYIAALVDGVPRSTNVEHYARIIKEKATLRNLIFSANKILTNAYEAEQEADVILDEAEHAIFAIADDKVRDGFVSLRDLAQSSLDTIEKLHARKELITGVPTGFTDLDEMTSGLQPSDLIIVAARPSMGKTSLALNIAQHVGTKTDMTDRKS